MIVSAEELMTKFLGKIGLTNESKANELWLDLINAMDRGLDKATREQLLEARQMNVCYDVENGIMRRRNFVNLVTRSQQYEFKVDDEPFVIGNIKNYEGPIDEFFHIVMDTCYFKRNIEFEPECKNKIYMVVFEF